MIKFFSFSKFIRYFSVKIMGVGKSVLVSEETLDFYEEFTVIKSVSSCNCKDVIRLLVSPIEFKGNIEKSLCVNPSYVVVLVDQFSLQKCFSIYRTETLQDGESNFK